MWPSPYPPVRDGASARRSPVAVPIAPAALCVRAVGRGRGGGWSFSEAALAQTRGGGDPRRRGGGAPPPGAQPEAVALATVSAATARDPRPVQPRARVGVPPTPYLVPEEG